MNWSRRSFLKVAGVSLLGVGAKPVLDAIAGIEPSKIPAAAEALKGKRWAMVVDLKKFKTDDDYKRCVDACHRAHNVPDFGNPKDEIKWIWKEPFKDVFPGQENKFIGGGAHENPVLVLCNHCDNPPCVRVCPTKATFKREEDGIVMMDYHRCIGCRFCVAGCPYGARSMNFRDPRSSLKEINPDFPTRTKGVVEKCNFCVERLVKGLQPACVEASGGGLIFGDLKNPESEVRKVLEARFAIRRRPDLGTLPQVYYIV